MSHQLTLILALPLLGALAAALLPASRGGAVRWFAALVAVADAAAAAPLWSGYDPQNAAFQFLERIPIAPAAGFEYFVGVDGFSALLILMTTVVGASVLAGTALDRAEPLPARSSALVLLLMASLVGAFMALDFLLFVIAVGVALSAVWRLVARTGGDRRAGRWLAASGGTAFSALVAAMLALYVQNHSLSGAWSFDMTELHGLQLPSAVQAAIFGLLFVAFALLLALAPFHGWFVRSSARMPIAVVAMIAAAFVKLGSYGLLRIAMPIVPGTAARLAPYVAWLSIGAAAFLVVRLAAERQWRRAIARLALLQMTLVVLGAFAFNDTAMSGSMLQQIAHGLSIAALLLLAPAVVLRDDGDRTVPAAVQNARGDVRWRGAFAGVAALAAVGVPFTGAFTGMRLMASGLQDEHALWAIALIALGAGAAAAVLRLSWLTFVRARGAAGVETRALPLVAALPLLAGALWMGVQPDAFLERLRIASHHVVSHVNPAVGNAAECDTIPTPEKVEATPGAQFLSAVPCGPDGEPLEPPPASSGAGPEGGR